MWLSEKAVTDGAGPFAHAQVGTVTIGGKYPAVLLDGEYRNLEVLSPQGIAWRPAAGTQVMVAETDDRERFIVGAVDSGSFSTLEDGEVCLRNGGAWLKLDAGGTISGEGDVHWNGNVYITGRLFLNGAEVKPGGLF